MSFFHILFLTSSLSLISHFNAADDLENIIKIARQGEILEKGKAIDALGKSENIDRVVPVLIEILNDAELIHQNRAYWALIALAEHNDRVVEAIVQMLKHPSSQIRHWAISCLSRLENKSEVAVPELLQVVKEDPDEEIRGYAILLLGRMNKKNDVIVPVILEALKDPSIEVKMEAVKALRDIKADPQIAVQYLLSNLNSQDFAVKEFAVWSLPFFAQNEETTDVILSTFIQLLREKKSGLERSIIEGIGKLGKKAKSATPLLLERAKDSNAEIRYPVLRALQEVSEPEDIIILMIDGLGDPDFRIQAMAEQFLKSYSLVNLKKTIRYIDEGKILVSDLKTYPSLSGLRIAYENFKQLRLLEEIIFTKIKNNEFDFNSVEATEVFELMNLYSPDLDSHEFKFLLAISDTKQRRIPVFLTSRALKRIGSTAKDLVVEYLKRQNVVLNNEFKEDILEFIFSDQKIFEDLLGYFPLSKILSLLTQSSERNSGFYTKFVLIEFQKISRLSRSEKSQIGAKEVSERARLILDLIDDWDFKKLEVNQRNELKNIIVEFFENQSVSIGHEESLAILLNVFLKDFPDEYKLVGIRKECMDVLKH